MLGERLARRLLPEGALRGTSGGREEIERLTLLDVAAPRGAFDPRVRLVTGSISDPGVIAAAMDEETDWIFHLAAVVSGQAEDDFALGMQVNFEEMVRSVVVLPAPFAPSNVAISPSSTRSETPFSAWTLP